MLTQRERQNDGEEALRTMMDSHAAQMWTALPGIITGFDPVAVTCSVQPAIKGVVTGSGGKQQQVDLPLLVDVPVVFMRAGDFVLTFPVRAGDACLVVFASRCIDGWWQQGDVAAPLSPRMHDLSDGFALIGPFSSAGLTPAVNIEDVQLRLLDGKAFVAIKPDQTIEAVNEKASVTLTPDGSVQSVGAKSVTADAPEIVLTGGQSIMLNAPQIVIAGNLTWTGHGGGAGAYAITGQLNLDGSMHATQQVVSGGDQVSGGISQIHHTHPGDSGGTTGEAQ